MRGEGCQGHDCSPGTLGAVFNRRKHIVPWSGDPKPRPEQPMRAHPASRNTSSSSVGTPCSPAREDSFQSSVVIPMSSSQGPQGPAEPAQWLRTLDHRLETAVPDRTFLEHPDLSSAPCSSARLFVGLSVTMNFQHSAGSGTPSGAANITPHYLS